MIRTLRQHPGADVVEILDRMLALEAERLGRRAMMQIAVSGAQRQAPNGHVGD
jgi:hypothetical protein